MDSVFSLTDGDRVPVIINLIHSFGCTYICLWSYNYSPSPPHNSYLSMNYGYFNEVNLTAGQDQPSSSSTAAAGSNIAAARTLFEDYRQQSIFLVDSHDRVPGLAFMRNRAYLELREPELHRLSSSESQRRFYQEAGIKIALFMGCNSGEIELGMSNLAPQISNLEMEMRNLFPQEFSSQPHELPIGVPRVGQGGGDQQPEPPRLLVPPPEYHQEQSQQHRSAPSSSSSIGSPAEYRHPSLLDFTIPSTPSSSSYYRLVKQLQETNQQQQLVSTNPLLGLPTTGDEFPTGIPSTSSTPPALHDHHQSAIHLALNQSIPTPESTDSAITRAILAILSSSNPPPPPPPAETLQSLPPYPPQSPHAGRQQKASAFKRYASTGRVGLGPAPTTIKIGRPSLNRRQNVWKRIVAYLRNLNNIRLQDLLSGAFNIGGQGSRPTGSSSTQLNHMIMERKRRQKISESFQTLKAMLPPGTKKDKASVLRTTKEYLHSLKAQISELNRRNQILEAHLHISTRHQFPSSPEAGGGSSSGERQLSIDIVPIVPASPTSSEDRMVDLYVALRSLDSSPADVTIRILEFLKQVREISVISMDAQSLPTSSDQSSTHRVTMRLRIEGNYQWEESAFLEAVKRVLADMAIH